MSIRFATIPQNVKTLFLNLFFILVCNTLLAQLQDSIPKAEPANGKVNYLPVVYFSPETSLALGATTLRLFHVGDESRTSNVSATAIYTVKNQLLIDGLTTVFMDHEKYLIKGRVNARKFPENFYGIGEKTLKENKVTTSYSFYNVSGTLYRKVFKGMFLGLQGTYNDYFDVSFKNATPPTDLVGQSGARNIGIGASFLLDRRDNIVNATKGVYTELSMLSFSNRWGSKYNYNAYTIDFRKYVRISKSGVLAFQVLGLIKAGTVPFLQLSYLGGSDIMRGFYSGRYRDKTLLATQIEYRRQFTREWGAVAFLGVGNVTEQLKNFDLKNIKNSVGLGARWMIDPKDRLNVRLDGGFGNGQFNFYIAIAEAF